LIAEEFASQKKFVWHVRRLLFVPEKIVVFVASASALALSFLILSISPSDSASLLSLPSDVPPRLPTTNEDMVRTISLSLSLSL
jgi:hypothetical protein